ncbi:exo-beta-N-acetylmuramidase NamZ domain-containing protein [Evansella clarkii]|uniref:exo-beta-N-acetylmuramidase NamZ family protein n=1 Tax=Evansella clarkii TaxID=79879 RepID=UPI00099820F3|nr:DUF1343 domain-containing protein [Evansella clarkii]
MYMKNSFIRSGTAITLATLVILSIFSISAYTAEAQKGPTVELGIDRLIEKELDLLKDKRVGLVTNVSGVNGDGKMTIDVLHEHPEVDLRALYGPEHGIRGDIPGGQPIDNYVDPDTGLPVYSLYGATWEPTPEMLEDVDVLVFDIQDVGSNVYTYIYTMGFVMEAAAKNDKEVVILDRPNPMSGERVEGPVRDSELISFMGRYLLPVRHGMTIGELAYMFNDVHNLGVELEVVEMKHWRRDMYFGETGLDWVAPSPNMPSIETSYLYTGTVLMVDTNISVGLGTDRPFEYIGAPWADGEAIVNAFEETDVEGVKLEAITFTPEANLYAGQEIEGVEIIVEDPHKMDVVSLGLNLLTIIKNQSPEDFRFTYSGGRYLYDTLIGHADVRPMLADNVPVNEIMAMWEDELQEWNKEVRYQYLLYPPFKGKPFNNHGTIGILPHDLSLSPGQTEELDLYFVDRNSERSLLDPENVSVSIEQDGEVVEWNGDGTITALSEGTATIKVGYGRFNAEREVTVAQNIIENIRFGEHPTYTRIVLDLNRDIDYSTEKVDDVITLSVPFAVLGENIADIGEFNIPGNRASHLTIEASDEEILFHFHLLGDYSYSTPSFSNRIVIDIED